MLLSNVEETLDFLYLRRTAVSGSRSAPVCDRQLRHSTLVQIGWPSGTVCFQHNSMPFGDTYKSNEELGEIISCALDDVGE